MVLHPAHANVGRIVEARNVGSKRVIACRVLLTPVVFAKERRMTQSHIVVRWCC